MPGNELTPVATGPALLRMEADVTTVVRGDTACISALHVLKVYAQRLGCDLRSSRLVSRVMASSFLVVSYSNLVWYLVCFCTATPLNPVPAAYCSKVADTLGHRVPRSCSSVFVHACITSIVITWCPAGHRCAVAMAPPCSGRPRSWQRRCSSPPAATRCRPSSSLSHSDSSACWVDVHSRAAQTGRAVNGELSCRGHCLSLIHSASQQAVSLRGHVWCLDEQSACAGFGSVCSGLEAHRLRCPFQCRAASRRGPRRWWRSRGTSRRAPPGSRPRSRTRTA